MAGKIKTAIRIIRKGNVFDVLEAVYRNLRKAGIYIQINEFYSHAPAERLPGAVLAGFSTRRIKPDDVVELSTLSGKPEQTFLDRLHAMKDECWGIFFKDSLAGYTWISTRTMRVPELELERPLASNELYLYDEFIHERYHRRGLFGAFLNALLKRIGPEGKTVVVSVDWTNYISRKAHLSHGFHKTGTGRLIKFGQWWKLRRFRINPPADRAAGSN